MVAASPQLGQQPDDARAAASAAPGGHGRHRTGDVVAGRRARPRPARIPLPGRVPSLQEPAGGERAGAVLLRRLRFRLDLGRGAGVGDAVPHPLGRAAGGAAAARPPAVVDRQRRGRSLGGLGGRGAGAAPDRRTRHRGEPSRLVPAAIWHQRAWPAGLLSEPGWHRRSGAGARAAAAAPQPSGAAGAAGALPGLVGGHAGARPAHR